MTMLLALRGVTIETWRDALAAAAPDLPVVVAGEACDPATIRYALVWKPQPGLLADLPNLQAIFSLGAGVDHLMGDPTLPGAPVVRVVDPDLTGRMTEWVVLQVLMHHRRQRLYDRQQRDRVWRDLSQPAAREIRVGVMGLGVLGLDAAKALMALGFDVAGWSRTVKGELDFPAFHGEAGLDLFLARTDILVVLLPLTPDTRGLLDGALLAKLAQGGRLGGPVLINAGRGGLQVETDILAALQAGTLVGGSLDVFQTEPLPADSPLWADDRLVITPHVAAESDPMAIGRYVASQIAGFERGEPLQNVVDRSRGY
ncbi:2-hydroxyacid dehydrogenase [Methylobrevis pamukkalensis]|uniref:Glyoxylate/hydroxypyruvate reductase A n=1 Tax=Methylobrevis pamukkalensis TaxID=1439726 RepID=A0A1E3H7U8_9HYPH|nr:glyoxylate/hydroxypyruvate reductase A [Methylobrevis pamukkalensis]ODN72384.1 Glyoxylate/hydroxypyruvate reductase A [Methylobrevis pamukkalensis]